MKINENSDVVVVGAGIVGLAHALAAARRGLRVTVVDKDDYCVGASIRNFGFITVTGQSADRTWLRARRSRDTWLDVCASARVPIVHRGLWVLAQRPEAMDVLETFAATEMGDDLELFTADEISSKVSVARADALSGGMYSPHELRVESSTAIPALSRWLAIEHGVRFIWGQAVSVVEDQTVHTTDYILNAQQVVLCPGADFRAFLEWIGDSARAFDTVNMCRLQMMRVRPERSVTLTASIMSDLSLIRYAGYATLPAAGALRTIVEREQAREVANGIHLIAVGDADGGFVVGDSHHYRRTVDPFASDAVDGLILDEFERVINVSPLTVLERWTGLYPSAPDEDCKICSPEDWLRMVVVTSGTGASTAFAIAEEVFDGW